VKQISLGILSVFGWTALAVLVSLPARASVLGAGLSGEADIGTMPVAILQCRKQVTCDPKLIVKVLAKRDVGSTEVRTLLPRFVLIAGIQAELWDDGILEGPYEAESNIVLDRVEAFLQNNQLLAYRVTYSARAWRLGRGGARVEDGRIAESAFVSISLKGFFRDESAVALFRPLK